MLREKELKATSGMFALMTGLAVLALAVLGFVRGGQSESPAIIIASSVVMLVAIIMMAGLFTVNPNDAKVLTLFGRYIGTVREAGLWFANPFYAKKRISLRVRNLETSESRVDADSSNTIEMAAGAVWRVVASSVALISVDSY